MSDFYPTFIGIGAQKCASTWVYRILEDHPEVWVSDRKELDFFSLYYDRGFQWYERHFKNAEAEIRGEISPSYFHDALSPVRAAAYKPDLKILITLRDPVERAFSNHLHEIRLGFFQGPDLRFEAGLKNNVMYLEKSKYAQHIKRWMAHFPKDRFLVLLQEEIRDDPMREAESVYRFLNVTPGHESQFLHRRANTSFGEKIRGVDAVFRYAGKIGRRFGASSIIERLRHSQTIVGLREANRHHLSKAVPPMQAATAEKLYALFARDTLELASIIGRKTLPWNTWIYAASMSESQKTLIERDG